MQRRATFDSSAKGPQQVFVDVDRETGAPLLDAQGRVHMHYPNSTSVYFAHPSKIHLEEEEKKDSTAAAAAAAQIASIRDLASPPASGPIVLPAASTASPPPVEMLSSEIHLQSTRAIYVIRCREDNKHLHYVGRVTVEAGTSIAGRKSAIWKRFREHKKGEGSAWTKRHGAYEVVAWHLCAGAFDEEKWTLVFMQRHGPDNVRGGSMTRRKLDVGDKERVSKCFRNELDLCLECGAPKSDHWVQNCAESTKKTTTKTSSTCSWFSSVFHWLSSSTKRSD